MINFLSRPSDKVQKEIKVLEKKYNKNFGDMDLNYIAMHDDLSDEFIWFWRGEIDLELLLEKGKISKELYEQIRYPLGRGGTRKHQL